MAIYKKVLNIIFSILISIILSSIFNKKLNNELLNTIYTISGIMFSIGMGILCTLTPNSIANNKIYSKVKQHIIDIRNSYLMYFAAVSIPFLLKQVITDESLRFIVTEFHNIKLFFDLAYAVLILNIFSIFYFIINFIAIQKLNFEISDISRHK